MTSKFFWACGATAPAGVSLAGSTLSVDPTDPAYDHLAVGEHTTITVSYNVRDTHDATVAQTELEKIPTARDPWAVLRTIPGVLRPPEGHDPRA